MNDQINYVARPYQKYAENHIIDNRFSGLFLDMGLGKTVTTLTAIKQLIYTLDVRRVLIIAPLRVASTVWTDEIEKWSHLNGLKCVKVLGSEKKRLQALNEKAHIYLINRELTEWLVSVYGGMYLPFDMLVVDELSSFKNPKSKRFQAIKQVRHNFTRIVGLTGTPTPNGLIDLWSQMYILDGGERLFKTITRYRETFFKPSKSNGHIVYKYAPLEGSEDQILNKIGDICVSMKTEDYITLPDVEHIYINVDLHGYVYKGYKDFERDSILAFIDSGIELTAMHAAALNNKLLQYSNGAVYYEKQVDLYSKPVKEVIKIHDQKLEALDELIESANGRPVLIAYQFQHDKDRILERYKKLGVRELKTDKDIKDWNAGAIPIMITHPASAGHGLNLQHGGNILIWFGETYNLELFQQFNKRLHRSGQTSKVFIYHIICRGTIDAEVIRSRDVKEGVQNFVMSELAAKIDEYKNMYR